MVERNTVHHMSAIELATLLGPKSVDLVIADPPYGIGYKADFRMMNSGREPRRTASTFGEDVLDLTWIEPVARTLRPNSCMYVFCDWRNMQAVMDHIELAGLKVKMPIIWNKMHWGVGDLKSYGNQIEMIIFATNGRPKMNWQKRGGNVWTITKLSTINNEGNYDNPTQKPEELIKLMLQHGSRIGDLVFDPFCGSGTTAAAAKKLGRDYVTCDISEYQIAIARERLQQPVTKLLFA